MDSCWKNTPEEILQIILRFACSRLVYRDGCYIEIGKVKNDFDNVNNFTIRNLEIRQTISRNMYGQWYFQFRFNKVLTEQEEDGSIMEHFHGLCYDFNWENRNTFEICYWSSRTNQTLFPLGTNVRTIIN